MAYEQPKIEPKRFTCSGIAELPPLDELVRLAQTEPDLIFEIAATETVIEVGQPFGTPPLTTFVGGTYHDPAQQEREILVQTLTERLPEHHVWDTFFITDAASRTAERRVGSMLTGTVELRLRFAISQRDKENNLPLFLMAAAQHEAIINPLMARLARQLGVKVSDFTDTVRGRESWWDEEQTGVLKVTQDDPPTAEEWAWFFHGYDCGLTNRSGVHVEAPLGTGAESGANLAVLNSFFFWEFIKTCGDAYAPLLDILGEHGDNTGHYLSYMEGLGLMRRLSRGWILTDLGRKRISELQTASEKPNV